MTIGKVVHLGEVKDWRLDTAEAECLTEQQRKPWPAKAVVGLYDGPHLTFTRPDGKKVQLSFELEDGNLRIITFGPDHQEATAILAVSEEGLYVKPGFWVGELRAVRFSQDGVRSLFSFDRSRPAPWGAGWVRLPDFGCAVRLVEGGLQETPLLEDGSIEDDFESTTDVTAPASQEYLDAVNAALGTTFTLDQFAGR